MSPSFHKRAPVSIRPLLVVLQAKFITNNSGESPEKILWGLYPIFSLEKCHDADATGSTSCTRACS